MRKYNSSRKFKILNKIRAKKSFKKKIRFRDYLRNKNRQYSFYRRDVIKKRRRFSKYSRSYKFVRAPEEFSLLSNTIETVKFINEIKALFEQKKAVFVVMKKVVSADHSTIVVLLSIMIRFKSENIQFNGDFPKDTLLADKFKESGFFQILDRNNLKSRENYRFGKDDKILTHASKNVDSELSEQLAEDTGVSLYGEKRIFKGLHRTLVELMQNSFNHAAPLKEGDKHWWISINFDKEQNKVCFAYIDYGVGIFESLDSKTEQSKWFNWKRILGIDKNFKTNAEILKLILDGDLHKTVTGEYFRGKGLPGIKQAMDRNLIANLCIVTNNVAANVQETNYQLLNSSFKGTFIYWEINHNTKSISWKPLISA